METQIEKLPKWAQSHILKLENQRDLARHDFRQKTAHIHSTREQLMKSCRELLAVVKRMPTGTRHDFAAKMIVERAQSAIASAAKEAGLNSCNS